MSILKIALLGIVAVVVFDGVASLASVHFGFAYANATVGSAVVFAIFGLLAGYTRSLVISAVTGAIMGLADATLGWAVSWFIGPGRLPPGQLTIASWSKSAVTVVVIAMLYALIGGLVGSFLNRGKGGGA
jgi:hypothetical protein